MKATHILQLIASVCMLLGTIINILHHFMAIPLVLDLLPVVLLSVSIVLYGIVIYLLIKQKG